MTGSGGDLEVGGGNWLRVRETPYPVFTFGGGALPARAHGLMDQGEPVPLFGDPAAGWTGLTGWSGRGALTAWGFDGLEAGEAGSVAAGFAHADGRKARYRFGPIAGLGVSLMAEFETRDATAGDRVALTLPLPPHMDELLHFGGHWAGEFEASRRGLDGGYSQTNTSGSRTSHDAFPGWVVGSAGFGEDSGHVLGVHLGWHGNYQARIERSREGQAYLHVSFALTELAQVDEGTYRTPPLIFSESKFGLNGVRMAFQTAARQTGRSVSRAQPVQLNTWEGVYFDHNVERLKAMASAGAALGAELFMLDDGWFGRRTDDTRGLGDWTPRDAVYPGGLEPLIAHVEDEGLQFGLWVEPEMMNADSALFEAHPDWILGEAEQPLGRGQYGLDLTCGDCFAHVADTLAALVSDTRIKALKWDMNRDLPQSAGLPLAPAAEALVQSVKAARPDIAIEACASGGGRADWGAMAWASRVWVSDNHDPDHKLAMLSAYSLFAPPEMMGTHIGAEVSHQTGRRFGLHARCAMAVLGSMGLELDPATLSEAEAALIKAHIDLYKEHRDWMAQGHMLAVPHPDPGVIAVGVFSRDRTQALITVMQARRRASPVPAPLMVGHLDGWLEVKPFSLDPHIHRAAKAQPEWLSKGWSGHADHLFNGGLPLPIMAEGQAILLHVKPGLDSGNR